MESSRSSLLEPKAIFFHTSELRNQKDWESCFYLKAVAVYSIVTKKKADTVDVSIASNFLISIANNCTTAGAQLPPSVGETKAQQPLPPAQVGRETKAQQSSDKGEDTEDKKAQKPLPAAQVGRETKAQQSSDKVGDDEIQNLPESTRKAVDAVYLLVAILHDLNNNSGDKPNREKLDAYCSSGRRQDAILDVIKARNQLRLSLLKDTLRKFPEALKAAGDKDPVSTIKGFKLSFDESSFEEALRLFCWYYSPFYMTKISQEKKLSEKENLLECLYSSLVDTPRGKQDDSRPVAPLAPPLPNATHLVQSGFGFDDLTSNGKIKAHFFQRKLHLPAMVFDAKLETVVVNLLEWERAQGAEKPVARYVMLLRELVSGEGDVRVLAGSGVLKLRGKKEGEVVELLRRLEGSASCPLAYPAIDDEVVKMANTHAMVGWRMLRNRPVVMWASAAALVSVVVAAILYRRRKR